MFINVLKLKGETYEVTQLQHPTKKKGSVEKTKKKKGQTLVHYQIRGAASTQL